MYYWLTQSKGLFVMCKYLCVMTETTETLKKNWTPVRWIAPGEIPLRSHSACLCVCVRNKYGDTVLFLSHVDQMPITSFMTLPYLKASMEPEGLQQGIKVKVLALFTPAAHPLTNLSGRVWIFP